MACGRSHRPKFFFTEASGSRVCFLHLARGPQKTGLFSLPWVAQPPVPSLAQRMYPESMAGWMGGRVALEGVSFIDPSDFFHLFEQEKQNDTLLVLLQGSGLYLEAHRPESWPLSGALKPSLHVLPNCQHVSSAHPAWILSLLCPRRCPQAPPADLGPLSYLAAPPSTLPDASSQPAFLPNH